MRPSIIRGSISYYLNEDPISKSLLKTAVVSKVLINECHYFLRYEISNFKHKGKFQIIDSNSLETLMEYEVVSKRLKHELTLSPLNEQSLKINFRSSPPRLIHGESKAPKLVFSLKGNERFFEFENMQFTHKDFTSKIHFKTPEDNLYTSLIIGWVLFCNPVLAEGTD